MISWMNFVKPIRHSIPDIEYIPINIRKGRAKYGRFYVLSKDQDGKNSGVMVLLDHERIVHKLRDLLEDEGDDIENTKISIKKFRRIRIKDINN